MLFSLSMPYALPGTCSHQRDGRCCIWHPPSCWVALLGGPSGSVTDDNGEVSGTWV